MKPHCKTLLAIFILAILSLNLHAQYFPEKGEWKHKTPEELGLNANKIQEAVKFAKANEYSGDVDMRINILKSFAHEPYIKIVGPTKHRGEPAGLIIKDGYIVAQWGDVERVDMTFSVTKSYLSTIAGLALDKGLIRDVTDPIADYVSDTTFKGAHNSQITWENLLQQNSDWSGTLFGQHDWADRPPKEGSIDDWKNRELYTPGTHYKYNDVRVNVLAYALLQVWRKALPDILKEEIMKPIDASSNWRWFGYSTSWVNIDGTKVQSVSGGGHSGGGLFINTLDHARFGLLFMRKGKWGKQRLISKSWVKHIQVSSKTNASYGYMWWLNKGERAFEGVPKRIFYAAGFGGNYIVVDRKNKLVIVTRWLEPRMLGEFLGIIYANLNY